MKSTLFTLLILVISFGKLTAQDSLSYRQEIAEFQSTLNEEYADPEASPLTAKALKKFKGHPFFPVDSKYRVVAKFAKNTNPVPFQMKTTTDRLPTYDKYGEVVFEIDGKSFKLSIYQSHRLRETEEYKLHLFMPFTDLTSGESSYGGGRYIDLSIPEGDSIIIDFNKAYTPYCAYNSKYSCPIPPAENRLPIKIEAGVKFSK